MSYDRPEKNITRHHLFKDMPRKTSIITLPSTEALCAVELVKNGIISSNARQQWVESRPSVYKKLHKKAEELEFNNVSVKNCYLEDYCPSHKVDLINADMESSFTARLGLAFENIFSKWLLPDASIVLWTTAWARNPFVNDFHKWFYYKTQENGILKELADTIAANRDCKKLEVVIPLAMFSCAMNDFKFEIIRSQEYRDTRIGMVAIRMDNFTKISTPVWPSLSSLIEQFNAENQRTVNRKYYPVSVDELHEFLANIDHTLVELPNEEYEVKGPSGRILPFPKDYKSIADYYICADNPSM